MSYKVRNAPRRSAPPPAFRRTPDLDPCPACRHAIVLHGEGGCRHDGFLCPCWRSQAVLRAELG